MQRFSLYGVHKLISIDVQCDLDLWPLTSKINRVHPLITVNMSCKFDKEICNGLVSMVFTSVTIKKVWLSDRQTHARTHTQTDAGQSDPYVPLCFAMIENNTKHSLTIGFIQKFGPTKFCSVRQNLEFCQTNVWQNSKVFRQHWKWFINLDNALIISNDKKTVSMTIVKHNIALGQLGPVPPWLKLIDILIFRVVIFCLAMLLNKF